MLQRLSADNEFDNMVLVRLECALLMCAYSCANTCVYRASHCFAHDMLRISDVITAGTAIRESLAIIHATPGAHLHSVVVALDRQERGSTSELSAIQELEKEHGVRVVAIVTLEDVLERLMELDRECQSAVDGQRPKYAEHIQNIRRYREEFGSR